MTETEKKVIKRKKTYEKIVNSLIMKRNANEIKY